MSFADDELLQPGVARDPYGLFARMRETSPVHFHAATGTWYITRHRDVRSALVDSSLSARPGDYLGEQAEEDWPTVRRMERFFNEWMLFSDPPQHTLLRAAVADGFAARQASQWGDYVAEVTRQRLAGLSGDVDLVGDLARPVATRVTSAVFGIPESDDPLLQRWSADLLGYLFTPTADAGRARIAEAAAAEIRDYLDTVILPRLRAESGALRGLLDVPADLALALFSQLLTGGVDPVTSCLGTALAAVLDPSRPDLLPSLATREGCAEVCTEALRHDPPFHFVPRSTTRVLQVGGTEIPAGSRMMLVIAAASRDPEAYPDPDRFLPGRRGQAPLAFGLGGHYCLGAQLARVVVTETLHEVGRWLADTTPGGVTVRRAETFGATTYDHIDFTVPGNAVASPEEPPTHR